jgi:transposase
MQKELKANALQAGAETQYAIRKAIIRHLQSGKSGRETAKLLDVSEGHVSNVKKAYEKDGIKGLKIGQRGRRKGEKRTLTPDQEWEIKIIIVDKHPEQLKIPGCMWTREAIRELIKQKYKIEMPLSTLGYYLSRWGFSVQRPTKRAYKQDEKKVADWVYRDFPGIKERAKKENAEIYWGDEVGVQNTANYLRGYAPIGSTPTALVESKKLKINMLSAITNSGKLRFTLYKDNMNADKLIDFMRRLVKDTGRKVFLILDNLSAHHNKKVAEWLDFHKDEIEVFFLPSYSPEYNPDELLNSDLKRGVSKRSMPRTVKELERSVRSHMKKVQLNTMKIMSFFGAPTTIYAA